MNGKMFFNKNVIEAKICYKNVFQLLAEMVFEKFRVVDSKLILFSEVVF